MLRILWNSKVHYRVHNSSLFFTILSQINSPISCRHTLILFSHRHLRLPSGPFPSRLPTKTQYTPILSPHTCLIPHASHYSITRLKFGEYFHPFMILILKGDVCMCSGQSKIKDIFYCCTVHFDNVRILFTNKCTFY